MFVEKIKCFLMSSIILELCIAIPANKAIKEEMQIT
jgi:hypothetical protein